MTLFSTLDEIRRITPEAVIGQSNLNHEGLAAEIRRRFSGDWRTGGVLQEPLLEAALPYIAAPETLGALSGNLLHPALVAALHGDEGRRAYRLRREQFPYSHQLEAWRWLADPDTARSVLVTSGTGSGKTECFLVPILDHLARKSAAAGDPLVGVEAIVLYPLNALIASQEERLRAWTEPFGGAVRFALYNGMLPDRVSATDRQSRPETMADREALRETPPPILVTNVTMLEYMLLRNEDAPILQKSKGKLRYIVLDEAHTYVGAQAAEIALLLRRVCLAFDVDPAEVRFVATSATLGDGDDIERTLQDFLSDVSGAPRDQVHVVRGYTRKPSLPPVAATPAPPGADDWSRFAGSPVVRPFLERLYSTPLPWAAMAEVAEKLGMAPEALATRLAASRSADGEHLAPLRVHSFHRATPGLWSCLDPACDRPRPQDWPFGALHCEPLEVCGCGAPAFEIVVCQSCGEPFLDAVETSSHHLRQPRARASRDEFSVDADTALEGDGEADDEAGPAGPLAASRDRLIACGPRRPGYRRICVEVRTGEIHDRASGETLELHAYDFSRVGADRCPACGTSAPEDGDLVRPVRFGAPFLLNALTPALLDSAAAPAEAADAETWKQLGARPPSEGRQLLSFTDSRQGTARLSAKLQISSERAHVRSVIYHAVQDGLNAAPAAAELQVLDGEIAALEAAIKASPLLAPVLEQRRGHRAALLGAGQEGLAWATLRSRLAEREEIGHWMRAVWSRRDPQFESENDLAEFLLLREFARRPPRANSPETLGLARLRFPLVEGLPDGRTSEPFRDLGGSPQDWRDYLNLLLTFAVRGRNTVRVDKALMHWIPPGRGPRDLIFEPSGPLAPYEVAWPRLRSGALGRLPSVLTLLEQAFDISLDEPERRAQVREVLADAWRTLSPLLGAPGSTKNRLDLGKAHIAPIGEAFLCPVTRRVLDTTLRGLTPYGAQTRGEPGRRAEPVRLPRHPAPFVSLGRGAAAEAEARSAVELWLQTEPTIERLRRAGAWRDVTDRIADFAAYFRSAEHSAQQPPKRLRRYESEFRAGAINVLNCSTTMEMGVDIGSVSHVMMTNLPPGVANYRQRVGRAGRRGQALSLAFTFCKDRPLDRETFRNPLPYLRRLPRPPRVALDSRIIVQRHVNALLFSGFVKSLAGDAIKAQAGPFFGCNQKPGAAEAPDSPCERLIAWIRRHDTQAQLQPQIERLTRKSALEGDGGVYEDAAEAFAGARAAFLAEWRALQALTPACVGDKAASKRLEIQLRRLCSDYLLSVLAKRGVLPGHGFPTDVVSFIVRGEAVSESEAQDLSEERTRFNSYPQRQLDVAIREYAPGSEVVLDGLVHRSQGVTLNWKRPAGPDAVKDVQAIRWRWRCPRCGESGSASNHVLSDRLCPACLMQNAKWDEYLQPAGFAVDLRDEPHADADVVSFVRPEPTKVSSGQADWSALSDPAMGRFRATRDGGVFFCNAGPTGEGYAICLACGRADAPADEPHAPLLGAGPECEGSHRSFARKQLLLGHEIRTDVFEFQPAGWDHEGGAIAFAAALREALAQRLGVEASEMGLAAEGRLDAAEARTRSIFLFDKASGGAGFAIQAADELPNLLPRVAQILDCSAEGCVTGCPACVLAGDLTDDQVEILDRQEARLLMARLATEGRAPAADQIGPDSLICGSVLSALGQAVDAGARALILRLAGELDMGALAPWSAAPAIERWVRQGRAVVLAVDPGAVAAMDAASRMQLRDLVARWGVSVEEGRSTPFPNGATLLAEARWADGKSRLIATRDTGATSIGDWGLVATAPLVRAEGAPRWQGASLPPDGIAPPASAAMRHIADGLDGPIETFGALAAEVVRDALRSSGVELKRAVRAAHYEDRYICTPLALRLCLDTIAALAPGADITLRTWPLRKRGAPPNNLLADWNRGEHREAVARLYGAAAGCEVQLESADVVEHARSLRLRLDDGSEALVIFDQGFGPWKCEHSAPYDFQRSPDEQARQLFEARARVFIPEGARTYLTASGVLQPSPADGP